MTAPLEHIRVTRTALTTRGRGTAEDPHRTVVQYWGPDGAMLWEEDPCAEKAGAEAQFLEAALERACASRNWEKLRADQLAAEVGRLEREVLVMRAKLEDRDGTIVRLQGTLGEFERARAGAEERERDLRAASDRWRQLAHLAMDRATQADRADMVKDARVLGLKL